VPQVFENIFAQYDRDGDGALTLREIFNLIRGHQCVADPFGVSLSLLSGRTRRSISYCSIVTMIP